MSRVAPRAGRSVIAPGSIWLGGWLLVAPLLLSVSVGLAQAPPADWLEDLTGRIDVDSPAGEILTGLGSEADEQATISALAAYFRSKDPVDPLWVIPFPSDRDPSHDTLLAAKAVDHLITTREGEEQFGDTLPWFSAEKKLATISRFPHFDYLAPAYFHTRDERFAAAMVRDMLDFIENVPISDAGRYHVQVQPVINPWNWVLLQWRAKRWMDALGYLRDSPSLTDEDYLRIILHIWQEIDWLVPRKVLGLHNGTLGNLSAILYAAIHYPEAASASRWLSEAGSYFNAFLDFGFYPREFLIELTLGYSEGTLKLCLDIFEGFPDGPLKDDMAPKLEALVEAHVGMMKPDRSIPRYGDHGIFDITDRLLRRAARLFDRPDLAQIANEQSSQKPMGDRLSFPYESDPYYLSGYYAMRDGWDTTAQYLSMDAGPYGTNHHHGDKLSITMSADGAEFIVDPGTSLYRSVEPGPRIDLRPGYLHNVITIDGADPNSGWDRHYGFDVLENRWLTTSEYDYLEGTYEYRINLIDVIWRRSILYIKGEYFVVIDALLGAGSHAVESNFQMAIGAGVETGRTGPHGESGSTIEQPGEDVVVVRAPNGASLWVASAPDDGLIPQVVIGDTTFPGTTFLLQYPAFVDWRLGGRGWVGTFGNESPLTSIKTHPAPALLYSGQVDLPHYSVRVLSPSRAKRPRPVSVRWLKRDPDRIAIEIDREGTIDVLDVQVAQRIDGRTKLAGDVVSWSGAGGRTIVIEPND